MRPSASAPNCRRSTSRCLPDEQEIIDFLLQQAAEYIGEHADVQGYTRESYIVEAEPAGTQDAMKRVLFGAAGATGGLATPSTIN